MLERPARDEEVAGVEIVYVAIPPYVMQLVPRRLDPMWLRRRFNLASRSGCARQPQNADRLVEIVLPDDAISIDKAQEFSARPACAEIAGRSAQIAFCRAGLS